MVDLPLDRPRRAAVFFPYVIPVLRHAGWFGVLLVLAPVIGPRGYGVFMLALGGVAIAEAALVEPLTCALTGLPTVEARHWSTALVTMMIGGGALWLAARAAAPMLDALVDEPNFPDMFQSLAILPLLGGLTVVPTAALWREERAGVLAAAAVAGFAAGAGIALSLAWAGAGAWALVAQIIVQRLVECLVLWASPGERVGLAWSAQHFTELAEALDGRTLAGVWPVVSRYGPCLVVGLALGPTATGLYMLAARLAEALAEIVLAEARGGTSDIQTRCICRVFFPAVLTSGLLALTLPPLIDLRWWSAVPPAQILLIGTLPIAATLMRAAAADRINETRWQCVQTLGNVIAIAWAAKFGLTAAALASVGWTAAVALAGLRPIRQGLDTAAWHVVLAEALRPCIGTSLAGLVVYALAGPIGLTLAPLPAFSLLTGCGWLIYLVIRGQPVRVEQQPRLVLP